MVQEKQSSSWVQFALVVVLFIGGGYLLFVDTAPVILSWETASEVGTAGFNVYRSDYGEDQFVQVNDELIPAKGDELLGAAYRYEDYAVSTASRYLYRIEEV